MSQVRYWSFTVFNSVELKFDDSIMRYMIYGHEVCPTTGRHHLQGYVQFIKPQRLSNLQKIFGKDGHYEMSKGDPQSNIQYCKKDGNFLEFGEVSYCGKRNDLVSLYKLCKDQIPIRDIIENFPGQYIRYYKGIDKVYTMNVKDRDFKPHVEVHFGAAGSGKTKYVYDNFKDVYSKPNGMWWDGYNYNETVLIDDYDGYINFREFLQLLDRYPHQVPIKGGYMKFVSKNIIFTSNINPKFWYSMLDDVSKVAMFRRIDVVKEYK